MKKIKFTISLIFVLTTFVFTLFGCKQKEFTITFRGPVDTFHEPIKVKRGTYLRKYIESLNLKYKIKDDEYLSVMGMDTSETGFEELDYNFRVYKDVNLRPNWANKKDSATVHYDTDGGNKVYPTLCHQNSYLGALSARIPTKKGYYFKYWEYEGKPFDFSQKFIKDKDTNKIINSITVKAKWVKEKDAIKVKFNLNEIYKIKYYDREHSYKLDSLYEGGRPIDATEEDERKRGDTFFLSKGDKWFFPVPTMNVPLHKHEGFKANDKLIDLKTHVFTEKETIIKPYFTEVKRHKLSFNTNGGDTFKDIMVPEGITLSDFGINKLPFPHKNDEKFLYWATEDGKKIDKFDIKLDKDTTFNALFLDNDHALVSFPNTDIQDKIVRKNETIGAPTLTEKINQVFFGFKTLDGKVFDFSTPITESISITPIYMDVLEVFEIERTKFSGKSGYAITKFLLPDYYSQIKIPSKYNNVEIIAILKDGLKDHPKLEKIDFPANLKFFETAKVFENTAWLTKNFGSILVINGYLVAIKDSVEEIDLTNLGGVDITNISPNAFKNHPNLRKVRFTKKISTLNEALFYNCQNLEEVILHEEILEIYDRVFMGCSKLKRISLFDAKNLIRIGNEAFKDCVLLETITFPEDAYKIVYGYDCFLNTKIEKFDANGLFILNNVLLRVKEDVEKITLPDEVKVIGSKIFTNNPVNPLLQDILFSKNTYEISSYAFYGAKVLGKIGAIPDDTTRFVIPNTVKKIGSYIFEGCDYIIEKAKTKKSTILKINYGHKKRPSSISYNFNKLENDKYEYKYLYIEWFDPDTNQSNILN